MSKELVHGAGIPEPWAGAAQGLVHVWAGPPVGKGRGLLCVGRGLCRALGEQLRPQSALAPFDTFRKSSSGETFHSSSAWVIGKRDFDTAGKTHLIICKFLPLNGLYHLICPSLPP